MCILLLVSVFVYSQRRTNQTLIKLRVFTPTAALYSAASGVK